MNQFDNYELTTIDYALKYYLEHNEMLEDDDIEWCNYLTKCQLPLNCIINEQTSIMHNFKEFLDYCESQYHNVDN